CLTPDCFLTAYCFLPSVFCLPLGPDDVGQFAPPVVVGAPVAPVIRGAVVRIAAVTRAAAGVAQVVDVGDEAQVLIQAAPIRRGTRVQSDARDDAVDLVGARDQLAGFVLAAIEIVAVADAITEAVGGATEVVHERVDLIFAARAVHATAVEGAIRIALEVVAALLDALRGVAQGAAVVTAVSAVVAAVSTIVALVAPVVSLLPPPRVIRLRGGDAGQTERENDG